MEATEQYRACGDYSGSRRDMPVRDDRGDAMMDEASMTQADRTWIEARTVIVHPWREAVNAR